MRKLMSREGGFTLIEMVVVIAIMGVLAAITVPLITNYLSQAKERAYNSDVSKVQAAVDAYYSAPDNVKFIGKRQYPIKGAGNASSVQADLLDNAAQACVTLDGDCDAVTVGLQPVPHKNPLGGTVGGNPAWVDDGDGIRSGDPTTDNEENVNGPAVAAPIGWDVATAVRQLKTYYVDTRDYIIDMDKLVNAKLLGEAPDSAADDNCPTTVCDGSYIYYVDANGKVQTLLATFPESDKTGFQDVHP